MRLMLLTLTLCWLLCSNTRATAQPPVIFSIDTISLNCQASGFFSVPVRVKNFTQVGSFQFTVQFDISKLDSLSVGSVQAPFLAGSPFFDLNDTSSVLLANGQFTFSYTNLIAGGLTVPNNTVLFHLTFKYKGGGFAAVSIMEGGNPPTIFEVTGPDGFPLANIDAVPGGFTPNDNVAPQISCPNHQIFQSNTPIPVFNIAATASDNCGTPTVGWSSTGATTYNQPNSANASGAVFHFGTTIVVYQATDGAGNQATCSFEIEIQQIGPDTLTLTLGKKTVDCNTATVVVPVAALHFDSIGSLQFSIHWNKNILVLDSVGGFNPLLSLNKVLNFSLNQSAGTLSFSWTTTQLYGTTLPPNNSSLFDLYFTVLGNFGAISPITFEDVPIIREAYSSANFPNVQEIPAKYIHGHVQISDTEPPQISCPPPQNVVAPLGQNLVNVQGLIASATDGCDATPTITFVRSGVTLGVGGANASGNYFIGNTTVTFTATDDSGNKSTCTTLISVKATTLDTLTFFMDKLQNNCYHVGELVKVPVRVRNFKDIIGVQFNVAWNEQQLSLVGFEDVFPGVTFTQIPQFWTDTTNGLFKFFGGHPDWPNIPNGGIFFNLKFRVKTPVVNSALVVLALDAVNKSFQNPPFVGQNGLLKTQDTQPPVVICPQNISVNADTNECSKTLPPFVPVASDDCSGLKSVSSSQVSNTFFSGTTVIHFLATDNFNNTASCTFSVTVVDMVPPKYLNCPKDTSIFAPANNCSKSYFWTPPTLVDGCGNTTLTETVNYQPGAIFPIGQNIVQYIGADISNLTTSCSFVVMVLDTVPPKFNSCPPNSTEVLAYGVCEAFANLPVLTATDACDLSVFISTNLKNGDPLVIGDNVIVYTAVDNFGNTATCTFLHRVVDSNSPKLVGCPGNITTSVNAFNFQLGCGTSVVWQEPQVSGLCATTPFSIQSSHLPGTFFPLGKTEVKYLAVSASGIDSCRFDITVVDADAPIFPSPLFPPNQVIILPAGKCDTVATWQTPVAVDICAVDTIFSNKKSGDRFGVGQHIVTYTAKDDAGNTATRTFTITVKDVTPPDIKNCPGNKTVKAASDCKAVVSWQTITATDDCSTPQIFPAHSLSGDTLTPGIYNYVFVAIDAGQNADTCKFTVTVQPSNLPEIQCPPNQLFECSAQNVTWKPPVLSGFCTSVRIDSTHRYGSFPLGATTVTYTASDLLNNITSCQFIITVADTKPPVIVCPQQVRVSISGAELSDPSNFVSSSVPNAKCDSVQLNFLQPPATDNCNSVIVTQLSGSPSGSRFAVGNHPITFRAIDAAGNISSCSTSIVVVPLLELNLLIDPNPGCLGERIELSVDTIPGAKYTWTGPQQNYPNTASLTILSLSAGNTGIYTVFADINGCKTKAVAGNVRLVAKPDAKDDTGLIVKTGESLSNIDVLKNDSIQPPSDASIRLTNPVQGVSFNPQNNTFSFAGTTNPGTVQFIYELCSKTCPTLCDMATVFITVQDKRCTFIPNIITPNGDGINEDFYIPCLDTNEYPNNSLIIYNQWGDKVFEASPYKNGPNTGWRGTYEGKDLPDGVYYYILKTSTDQNAEVHRGFVEILR